MAEIAGGVRRWREGDTTVDLKALEKDALDLYQSDIETTMSDAEQAVFLERMPMLRDIVTKARRAEQNTKASGSDEPSPVRADDHPIEPEANIILDPTGKGFSREGSAQLWMDTYKVEGEVIENPEGSGFVIKTSKEFVAKHAKEIEEISGETYRRGIVDAINRIRDESGRAYILEDLVGYIAKQMRTLRGWLDLHDRPDITSMMYKDVYKAVDALRIRRNLAAFDANDVQKSLLETITNEAERTRISKYLEDPDIELSPSGHAVAEIAREIYTRYRKKLTDAGILNEFIENYVNHIIKRVTDPTASFVRRRTRTDEGFPVSLEELQSRGIEVETDIAKLLPSYIYYAERALANKAFASNLVKMKTPEGKYALLPRSQVPLELRDEYFPIDDATLRTWSRFGRKKARKAAGDAVIDAERKRLFKEPTSIHRDAFKLVENVLSDRSAEVYGKLAKARTAVKRIIMYIPWIHGWNVESNVLMALGKDYPRRFRHLNDAEMQTLLRRMVKNGVELKDVIDDPLKVLRHPVKGMKDLGDQLLWDKFVKTGQIAIYDVLESRFVKEGLSPKDAGSAAGMMVNDLMGTLPRTWFTRGQRRVLRNLMFARNWNVSNFRTLTGALGTRAASKHLPKPLRFEGMTDAQLRAMGKQYRFILLKGVLGIMLTSNLVQAAFLKANGQDFHSTFNNERGHKFDIDTGMTDSNGRKIYVKNWLFRQIDDYAKLASGHLSQIARAKAEPMLRTLIEIVFNTNFMNREIRERGAPVGEQLYKTAKHAVMGVTPLDAAVGREGEVRTWTEALLPLTGTWIRHGLPAYEARAKTSATGLKGDMLRDYYDYLAEQKYVDRKNKRRIDKLIKRGKIEEAVERTFALIQEGQLSALQFSNIVRKIGDPLWARISTGPGGKIKKDFLEFLVQLPEDKRDKYLKELSKLRTEGVGVRPPAVVQPPPPRRKIRLAIP